MIFIMLDGGEGEGELTLMHYTLNTMMTSIIIMFNDVLH